MNLFTLDSTAEHERRAAMRSTKLQPHQYLIRYERHLVSQTDSPRLIRMGLYSIGILRRILHFPPGES